MKRYNPPRALIKLGENFQGRKSGDKEGIDE